jgi:hypothetical protein
VGGAYSAKQTQFRPVAAGLAVQTNPICPAGQAGGGVAGAHCAKKTQFRRSPKAAEGEMRETNPIRRRESCEIASMPRFGKQSQFPASRAVGLAHRVKQSQFPGTVAARGSVVQTNPIGRADRAKQSQFPASRVVGPAHRVKQSQFGHVARASLQRRSQGRLCPWIRIMGETPMLLYADRATSPRCPASGNKPNSAGPAAPNKADSGPLRPSRAPIVPAFQPDAGRTRHAPDLRCRLTNPGALTTIRVFHGLGVQGISPAVYGEVGVAQGRRRL